MNCTNCGAAVPAGNKFCPKCGTQAAAQAPAAAAAAQGARMWYVHINGKNQGPFARAQVAGLVQRGNVIAQTQVYDGAQWCDAAHVPELKPLFPESIPPAGSGGFIPAAAPSSSGSRHSSGGSRGSSGSESTLNESVSLAHASRMAADIRSRDVKILVIGTVITLLAVLFGLSNGLKVSSASKLPPELQDFWADIETNETTYDEVIGYMGPPADSQYSEHEGFSSDHCTWHIESEDGNNYDVNISFMNDVVIMKLLLPADQMEPAPE